jgi:hypothetical protein
MAADTVLCFDRDSTIDVNPHPDHDAVPIAWVKAWAHAPKHEHVDVWATGNQRLVAEAEIPGTEHTRTRWERLEGRDAGEEYPSENTTGGPVRGALRAIRSRFGAARAKEDRSYKPSRRDRLRLIKDCYEHPDSGYTVPPRFLVVDDADLADIAEEGWRWWLPWEFTESVRRRGDPLAVPDAVDYPNVPVESDDGTEYSRSASVLR